MATLGDAFIEIHADASPFERELVAELEAALIRAEAVMRQHGRDAGNAYSDGVDIAVRDRADDIGDTLADGLAEGAEDGARRAAAAIQQAVSIDGEGIEIPIIVDVDEDELDERRSFMRRWASSIFDGVNIGLTGIFDSIGVTLANAFDLGSNGLGVLLKQPAVLLAVVGALGGVVTGLLQVLVPVAALLLSIPAVLSLIGGVILTLTAVFTGLGDAISNAFEATNAKELEKAVAGLQGGARDFVASFYEVGQLWREIVRIAQVEFFNKFDHNMRNLTEVLGPGLTSGIAELAGALGQLFDDLLVFFSSPEMKQFIDELFPLLSALVGELKGPLISFLSLMIKLIIASLPFVERVVIMLGNVFEYLNEQLDKVIKNGSLDAFFDNATITLKALGGAAKAAIGFVLTLFDSLSKSGTSTGFLNILAASFDALSKFFASKQGIQALQVMAALAAGLVILFTSTIIIVSFLIGWLYSLGKVLFTIGGFIRDYIITPIIEFFEFLGEMIARTLGGIEQTAANFGATIRTNVTAWITGAYLFIVQGWQRIQNAFATGVANAISVVSTIKTKITNTLSGIPTLLYNAGVNLINGFINGIRAALPNLTGLLSWITTSLSDWKGPEDKDKKILKPAGLAVMQGFREGLAAGASDVLGDLSALTGMISVSANPNTFNFGRGAIQQNFTGSPSPQAAEAMGNVTGNAIANTVNQQTMRATMRAA